MRKLLATLIMRSPQRQLVSEPKRKKGTKEMDLLEIQANRQNRSAELDLERTVLRTVQVRPVRGRCAKSKIRNACSRRRLLGLPTSSAEMAKPTGPKLYRADALQHHNSSNDIWNW